MYRTQSIDTAYEAEQFQLELLRRAGPVRRFRQARSLTAATRQMSLAALKKRQPHLTPQAIALLFIELLYGQPIVMQFQQEYTQQMGSLLKSKPEGQLMLNQDIVEAIEPVVKVLDSMAIPYLIGGSVASSMLGIPRATNDADLVAALSPQHVEPFITALEADYYISESAMREAISRQTSFNLIHQPTMLKVDIFIAKDSPFDQSEMARRFRSPLLETMDAPLVSLASAEDMVLRKLAWYKAGGGTSEKQWLDVLGIVKMQTELLDREYLQSWAIKLNIAELLAQALQEAGLTA